MNDLSPLLHRYAATLEDVDLFDGQAFGISGSEAMLVDPQQRVLIQTTWELLQCPESEAMSRFVYANIQCLETCVGGGRDESCCS